MVLTTRTADVLRVVCRVLLVVALVVVAWASLAPIDRVPFATSASDKLEHIAGYTILGAVAALAQRRARVVATIALLTGFGFALELLQGRTGYRSFDLRDLAADFAGAAIGVGLVVILQSRLRRT